MCIEEGKCDLCYQLRDSDRHVLVFNVKFVFYLLLQLFHIFYHFNAVKYRMILLGIMSYIKYAFSSKFAKVFQNVVIKVKKSDVRYNNYFQVFLFRITSFHNSYFFLICNATSMIVEAIVISFYFSVSVCFANAQNKR